LATDLLVQVPSFLQVRIQPVKEGNYDLLMSAAKTFMLNWQQLHTRR